MHTFKNDLIKIVKTFKINSMMIHAPNYEWYIKNGDIGRGVLCLCIYRPVL